MIRYMFSKSYAYTDAKERGSQAGCHMSIKHAPSPLHAKWKPNLSLRGNQRPFVYHYMSKRKSIMEVSNARMCSVRYGHAR